MALFCGFTISSNRPMGKLPPHGSRLPPRGVVSKEWDDSVASTKQSRGLTLQLGKLA